MAIVARRVLQRLLRSNPASMSLEQRRRHAKALNGTDPCNALTTEWELLVLYGLSQQMDLRYETKIGKRRPDILATGRTGSLPETFIADVATIFETGVNERNPIRELNQRIVSRARQLGLTRCAFDVQVDGALQGPKGGQSMALKMPRRDELTSFMNHRLEPFLRMCAAEPAVSRTLEVRDESHDVAITFKPYGRTSLMQHPSFTTHYSTTHNPIFAILKRKADQFRKTDYAGPAGVVLCSAASALDASGRFGYGLQEITAEAFRQHPRLSFVLSLWVTDQPFHTASYKSDLYINRDADAALGPVAQDALAQLYGALPEPRKSGINAYYELSHAPSRRGRHLSRSWKMATDMIQISSTLLLEYLAGRISRDEFIARLGGDRGYMQLFEQKMRRGQMLVDAMVEHVPNCDDDWVVFKFGQPDPALAAIKPD